MKRSRMLVLASMFVLMTEPAHADTDTALRDAARALIAATPAAQQSELLQPFTEKARSNWHYTPRTRVGIAWKQMNDAQRAAGQQLLAAALSDPGLAKVQAVMALEIAPDGRRMLHEEEDSALQPAEATTSTPSGETRKPTGATTPYATTTSTATNTKRSQHHTTRSAAEK